MNRAVRLVYGDLLGKTLYRFSHIIQKADVFEVWCSSNHHGDYTCYLYDFCERELCYDGERSGTGDRE